MDAGPGDPAAHARHSSNRARESAKKGALQNAVRFQQEATETWRSLAREEPERFSMDLAKSLTTLANRFGQLHQFDQALNAAMESVQLCRRFSEKAARRWDDCLGYALTAQCMFQMIETRRPVEVYPISSETVRIWRQLYARDPKAFRAQLARSLLFQYRLAGAVGRRDTEIIEEAVGLWRQLASEDFSQHGLQLFICLDLLAFELSASIPGTTRRKASLAVRREANRVRRRLYVSKLCGLLLRPLRATRTQ